jgi:DNA-binding NtrC family response regulator
MKPRVLIIETGEEGRRFVRNALFGRCEMVESSTPAAGLRLLRSEAFQVAVVGSPGASTTSGIELVRALRAADGEVRIVLLAGADTSEELAIAAMRSGVNDYLRQPLSAAALLAAVEGGRNGHGPQRSNGQPIIGNSRSIQQLRAYVLKVAASDCNVLITGETGTGKEIVARFLHFNSARRHRNLVCVNCAALPDLLLESELFGYERGAFTGATATRPGRAAAADGGTLFLDEIGELSQHAQAALLRTIETGELQMLGARAPSSVDIRVVAATNEPLEERLQQKTFRADLFFRLNVARIHLPPLRERKEDLPPLVEHFIRELNGRCRQNVQGFTARALDALLRYDWPGNVRELRNVLEAAFINEPVPEIDVEHLPERVATNGEAPSRPRGEQEEIMLALQAAKGNKSEAAKMLQCSRMTLYRKLQKYGLDSASH